ncbi:hypothetical protein [Neptunomonas japonica]|uniref:hypothetical protein n=1 Tax=Neptunomonas japonica TaxID=417574 RepID=UPI00048B2B90|nr:hypothetical protein [Neptunomonas japonica]
MLVMISRFLASKVVTVVLVLMMGGGAWFIYSELQAKAVIEKELKDIKDNQAVVNTADHGLVQVEAALKRNAEQIKAAVRHATNTNTNDLTDESISIILCSNGLAHPSACSDP